MEITTRKGLDIPFAALPHGPLKLLKPSARLALDLSPFAEVRLRLLVQLGDAVSLGQPLAENKSAPGHFFVSPASGKVVEIRRGDKRRLTAIVIERDEEERELKLDPLDPKGATPSAILERLLQGGAFSHIRMRPFDILARPDQLPRAIFVAAIDSRPFAVPQEMQLAGYEAAFQVGLDTLSRLTKGAVHLVYRKGTTLQALTRASGVEKHEATGPHPIGNVSLHIHEIDPIKNAEDRVWTLSLLGVIAIGRKMMEGREHVERVISIAGDGILEGARGYVKARAGQSIQSLSQGRLAAGPLYLISGDPLTGKRVDAKDFLGYYDSCFSAIPINQWRERLHFLSVGFDKYSATRAYLSGHRKSPRKGVRFTANQHGEERAFIDSSVYDKVMPMNIPTMHFVRALLTEDYDLAERLGLFEVSPEDFALATFICPSKIEMVEIVERALRRAAHEAGY